MILTLTDESFYNSGSEGKLLGLKCDSGHVTVPPRKICLTCGSSQLETIELSGRGKIQSFTQVFAKSRDFPVKTPYTLCLVELDEGGKLLGILDSSVEPRHGSNVLIRFRKIEETGWPRIFFELVI